MVPLTCGKLQAWRGLGAVLCAGAACVAAAQGPARASPDVLVSSALERIGSPLSADPAAADGAADALIVSVRFTNASAQVVDSIRVTSEVPPGLQYVAGSASAPGSEALFSVDGALSFGRPDELTIEGPDGEVRPAEPAEYTHVRFILHAPLDAGATGIARFRAVPR
jgi:hypothetical protein